MAFQRYVVPKIRREGAKLDIQVSFPYVLAKIFESKRQVVPMPVTVAALIDTGAESSVIVEQVVDAVGVEPTGYAYINTPFICRTPVPQFHVRLAFPHGPVIETDQLVMAPLGVADIGLLIGRDILSKCLFIYNGKDESFTLSS